MGCGGGLTYVNKGGFCCMQDAFFFGYGSLVNRKTHVFHDAHPATAVGWRRAWRATAARPIAYLTALPHPTGQIEGLIAPVPHGSWHALDQREHAYARVPVSDRVTHPLPNRPEIAIYAIPQGTHHAPTVENPILLSYVDVVLQGYLAEFGQDGVARFLASTDGWDAPVLDDRKAPIYPRHQSLVPAERRMVDRALADLGAQIIAATPEMAQRIVQSRVV